MDSLIAALDLILSDLDTLNSRSFRSSSLPPRMLAKLDHVLVL